MDTTSIYMNYKWSKEAKKQVQLEFHFVCSFCHVHGHSTTCIHYIPNIGAAPTNRFVPHHPHDPCISEDSCVYFNTIDELKNIEFVSRFSEIKGFDKLSISDYNTLMGEFDDGKKWWVIGYIKDSSYLNLPVWEPKK